MNKLKIDGLDELIKAFNKLPDDAILGVAPSIDSGSDVVLNKARAHLVANGSVDTGELYRGIRKNKPKRAKKYKYMIFASVYFDKSARHGVPVELGHGFSGFMKMYDASDRVAAKPFLRPAADESKTEVANMMVDGINRVLDNFGGRR